MSFTITKNFIKKYKANFKKQKGLEFKKDPSTCLLPISVGQAYHESDKLLAVIKLLNKKFTKCFIVVCDTLQRHTLSIKNRYLNNAKLYDLALKNGNDWLKRNSKSLQKFTINYEITKWDYWLDDLEYNIQIEKIENEYNKKNDFYIAVQNTCEEFLKRYEKHNDVKNPDKYFIKMKSIAYLKEECAIMLIWKKMNCNFIVYPASIGSAIKTCHDIFIASTSPVLLYPLEIRFNKR